MGNVRSEHPKFSSCLIENYNAHLERKDLILECFSIMVKPRKILVAKMLWEKRKQQRSGVFLRVL